MSKKNNSFLIDYTEDGGKTYKEATVVSSSGGLYGTVVIIDDLTKEKKTVNADTTKMRVRISL